MNPEYQIFRSALERIATIFPDLTLKMDHGSSTAGEAESLYRGIAENTQHLVVAYSHPAHPLIHVRVYDRISVEPIQQVLRELGLVPKIGDQYDDFGKIDIDAFLN